MDDEADRLRRVGRALAAAEPSVECVHPALRHERRRRRRRRDGGERLDGAVGEDGTRRAKPRGRIVRVHRLAARRQKFDGALDAATARAREGLAGLRCSPNPIAVSWEMAGATAAGGGARGDAATAAAARSAVATPAAAIARASARRPPQLGTASRGSARGSSSRDGWRTDGRSRDRRSGDGSCSGRRIGLQSRSRRAADQVHKVAGREA